jgi:ribosomal protein S6--L-glutamate ligase
MRLYFILARRVPPVPSPVLAEVSRLLEARGFSVASGIAEEAVTRPDELTVRHDLYILKSHTELALSLAGVLHAQGAPLLNPYPSCVATQNKIVASRLLRAAGVPTPHTWVTGDFTLLRDVAAAGPLIIKPYLGHRGAGLRIVRDPVELDALRPPDGPVIVQEYIEGAAEDLKVYVVGEEVFAVRKPFSPDSFARPGRPSPVSPDVRDIALRCGRAFGLGLYGLDVVESPRGPFVVDLNTFPGYKGVPDAAPLLADYIGAAAERAARGDPIVATEGPVVDPLITKHAFRDSSLKLVLRALSSTPATPAELDEVRRVLDQLRSLVDEKRKTADVGAA